MTYLPKNFNVLKFDLIKSISSYNQIFTKDEKSLLIRKIKSLKFSEKAYNLVKRSIKKLSQNKHRFSFRRAKNSDLERQIHNLVAELLSFPVSSPTLASLSPEPPTYFGTPSTSESSNLSTDLSTDSSESDEETSTTVSKKRSEKKTRNRSTNIFDSPPKLEAVFHNFAESIERNIKNISQIKREKIISQHFQSLITRVKYDSYEELLWLDNPEFAPNPYEIARMPIDITKIHLKAGTTHRLENFRAALIYARELQSSVIKLDTIAEDRQFKAEKIEILILTRDYTQDLLSDFLEMYKNDQGDLYKYMKEVFILSKGNIQKCVDKFKNDLKGTCTDETEVKTLLEKLKYLDYLGLEKYSEEYCETLIDLFYQSEKKNQHQLKIYREILLSSNDPSSTKCAKLLEDLIKVQEELLNAMSLAKKPHDFLNIITSKIDSYLECSKMYSLEIEKRKNSLGRKEFFTNPAFAEKLTTLKKNYQMTPLITYFEREQETEAELVDAPEKRAYFIQSILQKMRTPCLRPFLDQAKLKKVYSKVKAYSMF